MSDPIERLRAGAWYLGSPGSVVPFELAKQIVTELQDSREYWRDAKVSEVSNDLAAALAEVERLRRALADVREMSLQLGRNWRAVTVFNLGPHIGCIDTQIEDVLAPVEKEDGDAD